MLVLIAALLVWASFREMGLPFAYGALRRRWSGSARIVVNILPTSRTLRVGRRSHPRRYALDGGAIHDDARWTAEEITTMDLQIRRG